MSPPPSPLLPGPRAILSVTGPDALRFLNGQLTNDIGKVSPEHSLPAAALNAKGGLDGICCVHHRDKGYLIDAPLPLRESLLARLDRYLIADDVSLTDKTGDYTVIHFPGSVRPEVEEASAITSCARFGLPGFDLLVQGDLSRVGVSPAHPDEWEHHRIEAGIPEWGAELVPGLLPAEAGLDRWMVSFDKGCYLGQEVVSRIKRAGKTNRNLVGLIVPDTVTAPAPIFHEGKEAGEITSISPQGEIALGFRKRNVGEVQSLSLQPDDREPTVHLR